MLSKNWLSSDFCIFFSSYRLQCGGITIGCEQFPTLSFPMRLCIMNIIWNRNMNSSTSNSQHGFFMVFFSVRDIVSHTLAEPRRDEKKG